MPETLPNSGRPEWPPEHPALDPAPRSARSPAEVDLTDRQRLAVVLQGAAWLAHLARCGRHLPDGFTAARVDDDGRLYAAAGAEGRDPVVLQRRLAALLRTVFRVEADDPVSGRGEARRSARALLAAWHQELLPEAPDRAVERILEEAPFLWREDFGTARRSLAALAPGGAEGWIAGPARWARRLQGLATEPAELPELLAGPVAGELWTGRGWQNERPGSSRSETGETSPETLLFHGHYTAALDALPAGDDGSTVALRLQAHFLLGQLQAARRLLHRLERSEPEMAAEQSVAVAETAVRVLGALGDRDGITTWEERAQRAAAAAPAVERRDLARRAAQVAVAGAWSRGDAEAMARHLEAARGQEPSWRWHRAAAVAALARDDAGQARDHLRAMLSHRRQLPRHEAAAAWNDLGLARARDADLGGAERAFRHALHLYQHCDGPRQVTLALANLAEMRLRRGRWTGVRRSLERSLAANRQAGNRRGRLWDLTLLARLELARGQWEAAVQRCREVAQQLDPRLDAALDRQLAVLEARALGWLGRSEEAAERLTGTSGEARAQLEPEEQAPLWALAGDRDRALRAVAETDRGGWVDSLWRCLLTGQAVPPETWTGLEAGEGALEPYRLARLVLDVELVAPGQVAVALRRRAVAIFRRLGAARFASRLEAVDDSPWRALGEYLAESPAEPEALERLLRRTGHGDARLWWEKGDEDARVLVAGPGGGEQLSAPSHGGRLVLTAPWMDASLEAVFRLVARDFRPPERPTVPASRGMVGESETFRRALARLDRLAAAELPVLILGESGTGKELAARRVHDGSRRADGPFVPLNCAALSETLVLSDLFGHSRGAFTGADRERAGVFETAQGGTVFLDEIGDLPLTAQGMLLRVLQEGEVRRLGQSLARRVDVRVVAATHRDLEGMVEAGDFRQDLFFRLRGARVELPPLRRRGEDLDHLVEHLLQQPAPGAGREAPGRVRLSAAARARLRAHPWPGNVRELQHVLATARALAAGDAAGEDGAVIEPEHLELPGSAAGDDAAPGDYHQQVEALRRRLVRRALEATGGNRAEAARRLGLSRQALSYLVKNLDIRIAAGGGG